MHPNAFNACICRKQLILCVYRIQILVNRLCYMHLLLKYSSIIEEKKTQVECIHVYFVFLRMYGQKVMSKYVRMQIKKQRLKITCKSLSRL